MHPVSCTTRHPRACLPACQDSVKELNGTELGGAKIKVEVYKYTERRRGDDRKSLQR